MKTQTFKAKDVKSAINLVNDEFWIVSKHESYIPLVEVEPLLSSNNTKNIGLWDGESLAYTIETIDDIKAYLNGQTTTAAAVTSVTASREGGEQTYYTVNYLTISGSAGAVATAGAGGQVNATFGSNLSD